MPHPTEQRAGLLALAPPERLRALADDVLATAPPPTLLDGPVVGTAPLEVREPVERTRFGLIDVLVTRAEVDLDGHRGWAMRLGDDRATTLAAALCDAEVRRSGPCAGAVLDLCNDVALEAVARKTQQWAELEPTIVHFEELD
ncbi:MAG: phosphonate C-P lyase system protein PhnG [Acidimicrobiia bacterium]